MTGSPSPIRATASTRVPVFGAALPDVVSPYTGYLRELVVRGAVVAETVRCAVRPGEPAVAMLAERHEHDAALIVMTTRCQGSPGRTNPPRRPLNARLALPAPTTAHPGGGHLEPIDRRAGRGEAPRATRAAVSGRAPGRPGRPPA
ncbi:MAG: hypothetical protein ACTHNK_13400, partial [Thermomicrobiales bacterium]